MRPDRARADPQAAAAIDHQAEGLPPSKRSEPYGALSTKLASNRFLRKTKTGKLRIDRAAITREQKLNGKFLMGSSDESLTAADLPKATRRCTRSCSTVGVKHVIDMRPAHYPS